MNTHAEPLGGKAARTTDFWRRQPANRILLVGDNDQIRQLMATWLICSGYQVDTVADILAGWKAVRTERYDLLITDHNPPKFSGVELVNWLRSAQMTLPAIVLSEKLNPEELNQNQCLQAQWFQLLQFAAVLRKPFTTDELTMTVNKALGIADDIRPRNSDSIPVRGENLQPPRAKANAGALPDEEKRHNPIEWPTGQPIIPGLA